MSFNLEIPKELAHLKIDSRGYPIPYFVSEINGKPEFRFIRPERIEMIIERKVCHICGKKLSDDFVYFISGPMGLQNKISTDAAMHRVCAEFSLFACPHLFLQKSERRRGDELAKTAVDHHRGIIPDKPDTMFLVKCDKWKRIVVDGRMYLRFRPVSTEKYVYENNKLIKAQS